MGELNLEPWQRVERESLALKKRYLLPVESKRPVLARRPLQFPPRYPRSCAKTEHTAATPSEPLLSGGTSVSSKRSIRGKSDHGSILRQPCRYYQKVTCTRTPCEYWYPSECQFYKTKRAASQETRVCSLITRLMNNQIKGRRKATSQKKRK